MSTFTRGQILGADELNTEFAKALEKAGGTMTGPLMLNHAPVLDLEAVTKQYVDAHASSGGSSTITVEEGTSDRCGVIIPMYFYPNDPFSDATFLHLLRIIRQYHDVPTIVIASIGSPGGPGTVYDAVWGVALTRLKAAGARVLGYVDTDYGNRLPANVYADIDGWLSVYGTPTTAPGDTSSAVQGIFFDQFAYNLTNGAGQSNIPLYQAYYAYCYSKGFNYVVGNPGGDEQPAWYNASPPTADMIVMWENSTWPTQSQLEGFYPDGHSYMTWRWNGVLMHTQPSLSLTDLELTVRYAKWIYVTDGIFSGGASNPWGILAKYIDQLYAFLAGPRQTYTLSAFVAGVLTTNQVVLVHKFGTSVVFPIDFGASFAGGASAAGCTTNATASTVITVGRCLAANDPTNTANFTSVGTITISAAGHVGAFTTTGVVVSFAVGDFLRLIGPASADATMAGLHVTLVGNR